MKQLHLRNLKVYAIVDDDDYEKLSQHRWYGWTNKKDKKHYVRTNVTRNGKRTNVMLQRMVINPKSNEKVQFRNGNPLDCRKSNLRILKIKERAENV